MTGKCNWGEAAEVDAIEE